MPTYRDNKHKTYYCKFGYKDWRGKYHQTTKRGFKKASDAKEYEQVFKDKISGIKDMTLKTLWEIYDNDISNRLKKSTVRARESRMQHHIMPYLGSMRLCDITSTVIREWQNIVINTPSAKSNNKMKQTTLKAVNNVLSNLLNYGVKYYNLAENPIVRAGSIGSIHADHISFWEKSVFDSFIKTIEDDRELYIFSLVLFYSGMRPGEMFALVPGTRDINFVDDSFDIRKTMDRVEKESTSPKTKSSNRIVPMPHFVMTALKEYLDLFSYLPDCIFATSYNAIERRFHNRIKKAGINDIRPYDLRHSHVSYLVHKKVPITAISKRLGHKNPKITLEFYSFMYAEDGADIASLLEESGQNQVKGYIDSSNNALPTPLISD